MKNERLREQMVLTNKVDGRRCVVASVEVTPNGGKKALAFYEVEDPTVPAEQVEISEANDICFRILDDPMPYGIPEGYSVEDGVLLKNGEPVCEQGYIKVDKIIGGMENALVLLCDDSDGNKQVYIYNPVRDRFVSVVFINKDSEFKAFYADEDGINGIVVVDKYEPAVKFVDEKEVEYKAFISEEYTLLKAGSYIDSVIEDEPLDIKKVLFRGRDIVIITERAYEVNEGEITAREGIIPGRALIIDASTGRFRTSCTPSAIKYCTEKGAVEFFGDDYTSALGYDIRTPILGEAAAEGFLYYVDNYKDGKKQVYVFANADATACAKIGVERTSDRGNIYSLV